MPEKREATLPGGSPKHRTNCSPETVATPARRLTEPEERELEALIAEQAVDDRSYRDHAGNLVFRYPPPPWQEVPVYGVHSADFDEDEREGQAWQLDLGVICDRLDAGYRLCVKSGCEEFATKHGRHCPKHAWWVGRPPELATPVEFAIPDELASDYYRQPETVSNGKRGPKLKKLDDGYFAKLPYGLYELQALFHRGRRSDANREKYDDLARHVAKKHRPAAALARDLDCNPKAIYNIRKRGMTLLDLERKLDEANSKLDFLIDLNGGNVAAQAENILAEDEIEADAA